MRVEAFDPGLTTGYAIAILGDHTTVPQIVSLGAQTPTEVTDVVNHISYVPPDVRIVEQFVGAGHRTTEATTTLKLVGFLSLGAGIKSTSLTEIREHVPQWRKAFVAAATALCKEQGFSYNKHAVDALAHILYFDYVRKLE